MFPFRAVHVHVCINIGGHKHTPLNLLNHPEKGSISADFDCGAISSSPLEQSTQKSKFLYLPYQCTSCTGLNSLHRYSMDILYVLRHLIPEHTLICGEWMQHKSVPIWLIYGIPVTDSECTLCVYSKFPLRWLELSRHGPLAEMSSAVTLTDPVCLTEWPFTLSRTDVCCCQSHALWEESKHGLNANRLTHAATACNIRGPFL